MMVRWLDVRKQGGRVAVSANYVLKWLTWIMHCNYSVLNKISETCYPPSLFGKVWQSWCSWGVPPGLETPKTPDEDDEVDEVDAGDVVEELGVDGWRRVGWWF